MPAVVYHGPGAPSWDEVPDPDVVDDRDAILRVDAVTICGPDLHSLRGDVPTVTNGACWATRPSARSRPSGPR